MSWRDAAATGSMILAQADCEALARRLFGMLTVREAGLTITSRVTGTTAFALGDAHLATAVAAVRIGLNVHGAGGTASWLTTNRLDEASLQGLVQQAEAAARELRTPDPRGAFLGPRELPPAPQRFFESVPAAMTLEARAKVFRGAIDAAEVAGLIGAGDLHVELSSHALATTAGFFRYSRGTYGEFSFTARTQDGTGSGWAWSGADDWARVEVSEVWRRAVELGARSARPVAVEPGRYTVILEPAAVAALLEQIEWDAFLADAGVTAFAKDPVGTNKIGLQMMDPQLWMISDPWDPDLPGDVVQADVHEFNLTDKKVVLFERGVLRNLVYSPWYAAQQGRAPVLLGGGVRFYGEGRAQPLEEMIASTRRGIWVNRLSNVALMNRRTLLLTGTTRDGTFLIENGKITKAIKNFRFTESPFFVFNKLEAAGEAVRASRHIVAPRLKVRDFEFSSLTDAI